MNKSVTWLCWMEWKRKEEENIFVPVSKQSLCEEANEPFQGGTLSYRLSFILFATDKLCKLDEKFFSLSFYHPYYCYSRIEVYFCVHHKLPHQKKERRKRKKN